MAIAILAANRIQDQADFGSTPGAGNDGYSITWNNSTSRFVLTSVSGGAVSSVFGRTGAVVATTGDYSASQVTNAAATNAANTFTAAQQITVATASAVGLTLKTSDNNTTNPIFKLLSSANATLVTFGATGIYTSFVEQVTFRDYFNFGYSTSEKSQLGTNYANGFDSTVINTVSPGTTPARLLLQRNGTTFYEIPSNGNIVSTNGYVVGAGSVSTVGFRIGYASTDIAFSLLYDGSGSGRAFFSLATSGSSDGLQWRYDGDSSKIFAQVNLTGNHTWKALTALTNTVSNQTIGHSTSGTPAAGFGAGLKFILKSSTTADQDAARLVTLWNVATHASAVADLVAEAYYNAGGASFTASEIWRGRAGASPLIGFLGATPVARQTHIADPSGGATQDAEARTAINSILNVLEAFGLVATS